MKKVFQISEKLPGEINKYIDIIDEVRYTPISKKFHKFGTIDVAAAYYNRNLSSEGNRIIFVRRNLKWGSAFDLLLTLVHEGVHAHQHRTVERYEQALPKKRKTLKQLAVTGRAKTKKGRSLRAEIDRMNDYVERWFRPGVSENGLSQVFDFECEATMVELKTARTLDAPPEAVNSGYIDQCDDAEVFLARWKDARLKRDLRRLSDQKNRKNP